MFSFSGKPETTLPSWFSKELRDRIGVTKVMLLPPLEMAEAFQFVVEVLSQYRSADNCAPSPCFPFEAETIEYILGWLARKGVLKPRSIMQVFGTVLEEAEPLVADGTLEVITVEFTTPILSEQLVLAEE